MSKALSIGITLLTLIGVVLLCSCVALYIIKEHEIEKRIFAEKQIEDLTVEKERLTAELGELKSVKTEVEFKLVLKEKELQNLQEKFESVRIERGTAEGEKSALATKLTSLQEDYLALKGDFEQLQQTKEILEQKLKDIIHSGVKLKTIIVEPKDTEMVKEEIKEAKETVEGEVLAINREYDFLIISLGMNNGITEDSEISIYNGVELIAVASVEKLYDNISAVIVNGKEQLEGVKVGYTVVGTVEVTN